MPLSVAELHSTLSPDGKTLAVMTSGYIVLDDVNANLVGDGAEFVVLYDVSRPSTPVMIQTLRPYAYHGAARPRQHTVALGSHCWDAGCRRTVALAPGLVYPRRPSIPSKDDERCRTQIYAVRKLSCYQTASNQWRQQ